MSPTGTSAAPPERASNSYLVLLISLCLLMAVPPFLPEAGGPGLLHRLAWTLTMLVGARATGAGRNTRTLVFLLALGAVLPDWLSQGNPTLMVILRLAFGGALLSYLLLAMVRHVLAAREVNASIIQGSLAGYLILGILWAMVFAVIDVLIPGSLATGGVPLNAGRDNFDTVLYFSMVTITTLGYGDVLPVTDGARMLAGLAAGSGQIYLAVLVARLVGIHVSQRS